jgi:hypothetical protein
MTSRQVLSDLKRSTGKNRQILIKSNVTSQRYQITLLPGFKKTGPVPGLLVIAKLTGRGGGGRGNSVLTPPPHHVSQPDACNIPDMTLQNLEIGTDIDEVPSLLPLDQITNRLQS